jgi:hypothetical protein
MQTSVLVQQTIGGSASIVTQTLAGMSDSISATHGNGASLCGNFAFSITSTVLSASASLNSLELYFSSATSPTINLYTALSSKVGTHTATVTLSLVKYPTVKKVLPTFTVEILPCIVTAVKVVDSSGSLNSKSYTLSGSSILSYQLIA